jgi:hypothetical protein
MVLKCPLSRLARKRFRHASLTFEAARDDKQTAVGSYSEYVCSDSLKCVNARCKTEPKIPKKSVPSLPLVQLVSAVLDTVKFLPAPYQVNLLFT